MGNCFAYKKNKNDRIVRINGFSFCVHSDYRSYRRNLVCYSNKLESYIKLNNLKKDSSKDASIIAQLINEDIFDDIKIIWVCGYY